jgi:hypothetical protein
LYRCPSRSSGCSFATCSAGKSRETHASVRLLHLAPRASIGNFNHVFGPPPWGEFVDRSFRLGEGSLLTSRHFVDVSGRVVIGRNCTIGGRDTHLWSHSLFHSEGVISLSPRSLIIENDAYVGARDARAQHDPATRGRRRQDRADGRRAMTMMFCVTR